MTQQGTETTAQTCSARAACDELAMGCEDDADCPGGHCCGTYTQSGYTAVECRNDCAGTVEEPFVCHFPEAYCPFGKTCEDSSWLPDGYGRCLPQP